MDMSMPVWRLYAADRTEKIRQVRDLQVLGLDGDLSLVVACDSDGGIGAKKEDSVQGPFELVGYFGSRVPMLEILACGAKPVLVVDTLAVEMEPAGREIIRGISRVCREAGYPEVALTGSTEENVPTFQTGIGITILGLVRREEFRPGSAREGNLVAVAGVPKSAPEHEVRPDDPEVISFEDLSRIMEDEEVRDVLPVGSRGIRHEATEMAESAGLAFSPETEKPDLKRSAGPSTCLVFSADRPECIKRLEKQLQAPVARIGSLIGRCEQSEL